MSRPSLAALLLALGLLPATAISQKPRQVPRHEAIVSLEPAAGRIAVEDALTLPPAGGGTVEFLLNAALSIARSEPKAVEVPLGDVAPFFGNNGVARPEKGLALKRYRVDVPAAGATLRLSYSGRVDVPLSDPKEEYTRGFRETPAALGAQGVYLAGSSFWLPYLGKELVSFRIEAAAPEGWHLVSQGSGTSRDEKGTARWDSAGPVDEVYLVGGPLTRYRDAAGPVEVLVYLRGKDDALAQKYLTTGTQYLAMYRALLGAYPYGKMAVVENFWETGYGMASFTLLGPQVIRFPFILHSSYPHEILHNWWGNSVFVDYESGNWCEGLTAYLADHLVQEQRGKGDEYRRSTLQKYRDYVKAGRDFPLTEFRSRHSAATEAVGYGKSLMAFHMLRRRLGDDAFAKALARVYRELKGRRATFDDLRRAFESASGKPLGPFFDQWIARAGAPSLAVRVDATPKAEGGAWEVLGSLSQTQGGAPYALDVPVVVQTAKGTSVHSVPLTAGSAPLALTSADRPLALHVDPMFDLFRRLDPRETPPSLGMIFGEPKVLALLPSSGSAEERDGYRKFVSGWASDSHEVEVKLDSEVASLPADRPVWLLGRKNVHGKAVLDAAGSAVVLSGESLTVDGEKLPLAGRSAVVVVRHPGSAERALGWIFADPLAALPGLGRKLPHYGKYSYLGFEGTEPVNVLKGGFSTTDSPLTVDLRPAAERGGKLPPLAPEKRAALAELPPAFSRAKLMEHVATLAAPERAGRGIGSKGLEEAAAYVEKEMQAIGLAPGGDAGTYRQRFTLAKGPDGRPVELVNLIGLLPGTNAEWKGQSVVASAHYDHLGTGWPDVHKGDEGKVHAGADDNASGVAVLLELARAMAQGEKPQRTVVFAFFCGEEAKLAGSRHYVANAGAYPVDKVIGVVNLDTVGRLGAGKVQVLGTGTASEWPHIFRGAGFVTGIEGQAVAGSWEGSDQAAFVEKGVPGVQVFTGAHADYHRPGDTADKVDAEGLVKVATYVREAVEYLAGRKEPMTVTIAAGSAVPPGGAAAPGAVGAPAPGPASGRRVSFGAVPDFAFAGPGVRLDGTTAGSPAEKAGLRSGDVLLTIDGKPVADMRGFSDILKGLTSGQTVDVVYSRDGKEASAKVTVAER